MFRAHFMYNAHIQRPDASSSNSPDIELTRITRHHTHIHTYTHIRILGSGGKTPMWNIAGFPTSTKFLACVAILVFARMTIFVARMHCRLSSV